MRARCRSSALSWADAVRLDGLEVHVQPSATPLLSAEVADGAIEWQQHLQASLPAFEVVVTAGDSAVAPCRRGRGAAGRAGRRCRRSRRRPGCPERRRGEVAGASAARLRASTPKAICRRPGWILADRFRSRSQPSCTRARRPGLRPCASKARCSRRAIGSPSMPSWRTRPAPSRCACAGSTIWQARRVARRSICRRSTSRPANCSRGNCRRGWAT